MNLNEIKGLDLNKIGRRFKSQKKKKCQSNASLIKTIAKSACHFLDLQLIIFTNLSSISSILDSNVDAKRLKMNFLVCLMNQNSKNLRLKRSKSSMAKKKFQI